MEEQVYSMADLERVRLTLLQFRDHWRQVQAIGEQAALEPLELLDSAAVVVVVETVPDFHRDEQQAEEVAVAKEQVQAAELLEAPDTPV
ncbi:MAG: hypothetical protein SFV21_17720 [Rhodospirillaceae bacterium]|nr:hypothetical protein [Rhodospirillaceae bacterium]